MRRDKTVYEVAVGTSYISRYLFIYSSPTTTCSWGHQKYYHLPVVLSKKLRTKVFEPRCESFIHPKRIRKSFRRRLSVHSSHKTTKNYYNIYALQVMPPATDHCSHHSDCLKCPHEIQVSFDIQSIQSRVTPHASRVRYHSNKVTYSLG